VWFSSSQAAQLELDDSDQQPENPLLSPAQYQRRRQLRRQVALLMAALLLFSLVAPLVRFAR
jgi:hypothetical protein